MEKQACHTKDEILTMIDECMKMEIEGLTIWNSVKKNDPFKNQEIKRHKRDLMFYIELKKKYEKDGKGC